MELTLTNQGYLVSRHTGVYHLARTESESLCRYVVILNKPEHRRRRGDWNLVTEKPEGQFVILCNECSHLAYGTPRHEIDPLIPLSRLSEMHIWP